MTRFSGTILFWDVFFGFRFSGLKNEYPGKHGNQVIQAVTFLYPIVGGHEKPLKGSQITIPKRSQRSARNVHSKLVFHDLLPGR